MAITTAAIAAADTIAAAITDANATAIITALLYRLGLSL